LIPFILIGEGRPARAVLDAICAAPGAAVQMVAVEDPASSTLAAFAAKSGIAVLDKAALATCMQSDRPTQRDRAWLISANSTFVIPEAILGRFGERALNFHPGLLPEYAGLHTHQWAIRNGEREFGVTIHRMERRIDTGAIVGQVRFPVRPDDTGLSLFTRCLGAGTQLFTRVVTQIVRGEAIVGTPQELSRRRLYRHRDALDGRICWNWTSAEVIDFIRAGNYEPLRSPTYVAQLDPLAGFEIEALRAVNAGSADEPPGAIIEVGDAGPVIACGDRSAVQITRARNGGQLMSAERWRDYVAKLDRGRLLGRRG
jgi:methionyl-tRNA formyltransferase